MFLELMFNCCYLTNYLMLCVNGWFVVVFFLFYMFDFLWFLIMKFMQQSSPYYILSSIQAYGDSMCVHSLGLQVV